jgi:RNA polymerase sigma factor (sigma-70 family)
LESNGYQRPNVSKKTKFRIAFWCAVPFAFALKTNRIANTLITNSITLDYANTHRDIIEQCKQGHRSAQFELYKLYSKAMYNLCLRMVKNELDAEDILQNSFIDVFTKLDTFQYQSSIGAWIKRIVINNCINFLKRNRLRFEELDDRLTNLEVSEQDDQDQLKLTVERINRALFELPDGYRVVFSLYMLEGYDHKEIADILHITEATSKSQFSRAKIKLRELIKN